MDWTEGCRDFGIGKIGSEEGKGVNVGRKNGLTDGGCRGGGRDGRTGSDGGGKEGIWECQAGRWWRGGGVREES